MRLRERVNVRSRVWDGMIENVGNYSDCGEWRIRTWRWQGDGGSGDDRWLNG